MFYRHTFGLYADDTQVYGSCSHAAVDDFSSKICAKLHYTDTGYGHHQRTSSQQSYHQRTEICHIPTSWHVEMLGSGIAMWQICCRIVVSSSVGGVVQHIRSRCPCSGVWAFPSVPALSPAGWSRTGCQWTVIKPKSCGARYVDISVKPRCSALSVELTMDSYIIAI